MPPAHTNNNLSSQTPTWYAVLSLVAFPFLLLAVSTDWIYSASGAIDAWLYLGYCRNFVQYVSELFPKTYYASRLGFIIPGIVSYTLFPPVIANIVLHLFFFYLATFSIFYTVRAFFGVYPAVLAALLMGGYSFFQNAVGSDNPDGAGLSYFALSIALTTKAIQAKIPKYWLLLAGIASAAMVHSHFFLVCYLFSCPLIYVFIRPHIFPEPLKKRLAEVSVRIAVGFVLLTFIFGLFNYACGGLFLFFMPSISFGRSYVSEINPWKAETYSWIEHASWLLMACLAVVFSIYILLRYRFRSHSLKEIAASWIALNHLLLWFLMVVWEIRGTPVLQYTYYASYLIPSTFIIMGVMLASFLNFKTDYGPSKWIYIALALVGVLLIPNTHWLSQLWTHCGIEIRGTPVIWLVFTAICIMCISLQLFRWRAQARLALTLSFICYILLICGSPRSENGFGAYSRIISCCEIAEKTLAGRKPRFWYDKDEIMGPEFASMASVYLWGWSLINETFPSEHSTLHGHAKTRCNGGDVLIVPSARNDAFCRALAALSKLGFSGRLLMAAPITGGRENYILNVIEILHGDPLGIRFDHSSKSFVLNTSNFESDTREIFSHLKIAPDRKDSNLIFNQESLTLNTHAPKGICAFKLGPFYPKEDGVLIFIVTYKEIEGRIICGALNHDGTEWLVKAESESKSTNCKAQRFQVRTSKGVPFWLGIGNGRKYEKGPSRVTLQGINSFAPVKPVVIRN